MLLIYNLSIWLYVAGISTAALFGNRKARLWIEGRKNWRTRLASVLPKNESRVWFHCSSLGEFEQGRPVMEAWKKKFPETKIVLTFFSPSGFEVRKNYQGADYVFYLPADTRSNARDFLNCINPQKIFFVKYEYWYHYFMEAKRKNISLYMVSAIFRDDQVFFKWYGGFFRKMFGCVTHFFLQNGRSATFLEKAGVKDYTIAGDTRFDRVAELARKSEEIPLAAKFANGNTTVVAGSTWPKDDKFLAEAVASFPKKIKLILAPHDIHASRLETVMQTMNGMNVIRFSDATAEDLPEKDVLVIDNMGMLSSLYRYGHFAYVGGGFGAGIHNILEAAVYGIPVFFGPNYQKFSEAVDLVKAGGAIPVSSPEEFMAAFALLAGDPDVRAAKGKTCADFAATHAGATQKIISCFE